MKKLLVMLMLAASAAAFAAPVVLDGKDQWAFTESCRKAVKELSDDDVAAFVAAREILAPNNDVFMRLAGGKTAAEVIAMAQTQKPEVFAERVAELKSLTGIEKSKLRLRAVGVLAPKRITDNPVGSPQKTSGTSRPPKLDCRNAYNFAQSSVKVMQLLNDDDLLSFAAACTFLDGKYGPSKFRKMVSGCTAYEVIELAKKDDPDKFATFLAQLNENRAAVIGSLRTAVRNGITSYREFYEQAADVINGLNDLDFARFFVAAQLLQVTDTRTMMALLYQTDPQQLATNVRLYAPEQFDAAVTQLTSKNAKKQLSDLRKNMKSQMKEVIRNVKYDANNIAGNTVVYVVN
ncbi:MAG: hypothetical protein AB7F40_09340 [Victivallaceae bacterium]|nr:hypothetical protein [Victivallaceae bacterium]